MPNYISLKKQIYTHNGYEIIPIRDIDKYDIMKWRNEQIYHLRQENLLTKLDQKKYFNNVIRKIYNDPKPDQILFSFMHENICIGYGGLVHINWKNMNAEISFIMNTQLEKKYFNKNWSEFLNLIENAAFNDLKMKNIFVYAFDVRMHLYDVLIENGYLLDKRLKNKYFFNEKKSDVLIYSKKHHL